MSASCPIVKKPENIDAVAKILQSSKTVNAVLRRFPQLGAAIRLLDPAADLTSPASRHVIAHAVLREDRQTAATTALSLLSKGKTIGDLFALDEKGYVTLQQKGQGRKSVNVHINDLLEGKTAKKYVLTPEQAVGVKLRKDIWDDLRFYYNQFGGKLSVDEDLFPRLISGIVKDGKLVKGDEFSPVKTRYGGSPLSKTGTFTRSRAMHPDGTMKTSAEMAEEGWRYLDPDAALTSKGLEVSRRTADEQFISWLTKQEGIVKKGDVIGPGVKTGIHPAKYGMVGFDSTQTPGLAGYYATPEVVKYINDLMSVESKAVIPGVTWLVNESRGAIASADFGTTGIQLLASLGADMGHLIGFAATAGKLSKPSNIFGTAVYNSFKSFFSEGNLTRYYADNKDVIDRWSLYLGGLKNSEYVSKLLAEPEKSLVMKLPLMTRFGRAFESSLDVAKVEYVKSLERIMGTNISATDKEALGGWVRNSTGMTSTSRLGVSPRQQDIEATWLFFSPRFTRSLFAMASTIFKLDKAGNEARLALGGLAAGATGVYLAAAAALGQEPDLDPIKNGRLNPGFFTLRVGDNRVGIGGGMRALARLSVDSYESAKNDPTRFISPDFKGAHSNPFLSFWRSRSSPLTGTVMDIWEGEDYKGTPIEDGNDYLNVLKGRTLPFSIQSALEARGQSETKAGVALAAGFGLNTNPLSAYQLYDEYLKSVRLSDGEQRFPDGANTANTDENQFKLFTQKDAQAQHLRAEYNEARLAGGSPGRDIQAVLDDRVKRLDAADAQLKQNGDFRIYRQQVNEIRANSRKQMEALHLSSVNQSGDKKLVQSWYETYADPNAIDPVTGGINSEGLESLQEAWKTGHPGEFERLIEPQESIGETPMETRLRTDRKAIADSGWWDTDKQAWDTLKTVLMKRAAGGKLKLSSYDSYAEYQLGRRQQYASRFAAKGRKQPDLLADIAMSRDPLVKAFNKIRMRDRLLLQKNNPGLTALLERWGYNHVSMQEYRLALRQGSSAELAPV